MKDLEETPEKKVVYLSFSQLSTWLLCPHLHYITSIEKSRKREDSVNTCCGQAAHVCAEIIVLKNALGQEIDYEEIYKIFLREFRSELKKMEEQGNKPDVKTILEFGASMKKIFPQILPLLAEKFGQYELVDTELKLEEYLRREEEVDYIFTGYIDLVLRTEDGVYHVIDWKTTMNGWNEWALKDKKKILQMPLYKHFWNKKTYGRNKKIETHYIFFNFSKNVAEFLTMDSSIERSKEGLKELDKLIWNAFVNKNYMKTKACGKICGCIPAPK